jgi:threonine synthase
MMNGYALGLICDRCKKEWDIRQAVNTCPSCGGLLETVYDLPKMKRKNVFAKRNEGDDTLWRYREFFPYIRETNIVSLGEGRTPLVKSVFLSKELGMENIYFKNDTMMPTGSFKDRGFSLAVSFAKEIGVRKGFTYSSGNAGASFAAYSSRGEFNALILVEYLASDTKKAMINLYGAKTAILDFQNFEQISTMLEKAVKQLGLYQFVNFINPIRHEAMKTYAYEIYEQLNGDVPGYMFHPVGTGGGIWGAWKGYNELKSLGITDKLPKMAAVQPEVSSHLKQAFQKGERVAGQYGDSTKTIAQSIAADSPIQGGTRILDAVYHSGGMAMGVSDPEILAAMRILGKEGISAEPSSAAAVAALMQGVKAGTVDTRESAVCVITGTALKQSHAVEMAVGQPTLRVDANVDSLAEIVRSLKIADF